MCNNCANECRMCLLFISRTRLQKNNFRLEKLFFFSKLLPSSSHWKWFQLFAYGKYLEIKLFVSMNHCVCVYVFDQVCSSCQSKRWTDQKKNEEKRAWKILCLSIWNSHVVAYSLLSLPQIIMVTQFFSSFAFLVEKIF